MRSSTVFSLIAAATAVGAQAVPAPVVAGNPSGSVYVAQLPDKKTTGLRGSVVIGSSADGKGVEVSVSVSGLPLQGGPFMYHIHEKPVPADGNCTGTGAHLDPYKRGEVPVCDASKPETCQTGDLSGKHGNITAQEFSGKYTDLYLSTLTTDPSYFGNLSVVFHTSNKTRISCANFAVQGNSSTTPPATTAPPSSALPAPTGINATTAVSTKINTGGPSPTAPATQPSNAAHKTVAGAGMLTMAAAAAVFML